jgi:hypothetical protein
MPTPRARLFPRRRSSFWVLAAISLVVLMAAPVASFASASNAPSFSIRPGTTTNGVTGSATWNSVNIATANTSSSAFHISFNGAVTILFGWSQPLGAGPTWLVNDARLQIFYFGFALATRDVTTVTGAANGNLTMGNWSTGPLEYILEGTYELTASLLDNSKTVWSQSFWVDVAAPFYILAALPIVLILIAVYELYGVATVGKQVALKRQKKDGPGGSTPSTASPASTATSTPSPEGTPPDSAVGDTTPPASPPASGGSS